MTLHLAEAFPNSRAPAYSRGVPQPPGQSAFRLRIQLIDVDPGIWRRILVPGSIRMSKLAEILLSAMGWSNSPPPRIHHR